MKYVKMLGLAAVAAMGLMAFLGASSASATVLCTTPNETTECTMDYPAGTTIDASLEGSAELETTGGTVLDTCTAGTVHGTTNNTGSDTETVTGTIGILSWGGPGTECTKTTDTIANGSLEIHWISGTDNGTVTGKNSKVTVNSIFGSCVYGTSAAGTDLGRLTGGNPATFDIEAIVPLIEGGGLCPADTRWTGKYVVTQPEEGLYVSTKAAGQP